MPFQVRSLLYVSILSLCLGADGAAAAGELVARLPEEAELNRYGLTLAWWGQAVLDPRKDRVNFLTADEQNVFVQSQAGIVSAFTSETGMPLWSKLMGQPGMEAMPAATNDEQLLLSVGLRVFSVDKRTGQTLWELVLPSHPSTSPELDDTRAYIGMTDGSVYAYDLKRIRNLYREGMLPEWSRNARLWRFKAPDEIVSPPISTGPVVAFGSEDGFVYGLTTKDHRLKYQFHTSGDISTPLGRSQGWIFITDSKWRLYCLEQQTGRIRWSSTVAAPIDYQPRVIGQQVFVTPHRNGLSCRSLSSGLVQWNQPQAEEFITASDERVYASNRLGEILVLNRETGDVEGRMDFSRFPIRIANDRTDRLYLASSTGLVIGLRERNSEYPIYHLYPERRPILPEFAPEEAEQPPAEQAPAPNS